MDTYNPIGTHWIFEILWKIVWSVNITRWPSVTNSWLTKRKSVNKPITFSAPPESKCNVYPEGPPSLLSRAFLKSIYCGPRWSCCQWHNRRGKHSGWGGPWRKAGTRGPHCGAATQSVSKLGSQGSFITEIQHFSPFPWQSLAFHTIGVLELKSSWVWRAGENLQVCFPQGYLDCKGTLSNAADKITCLFWLKSWKNMSSITTKWTQNLVRYLPP